jgi:hypothetical protein
VDPSYAVSAFLPGESAGKALQESLKAVKAVMDPSIHQQLPPQIALKKL